MWTPIKLCVSSVVAGFRLPIRIAHIEHRHKPLDGSVCSCLFLAYLIFDEHLQVIAYLSVRQSVMRIAHRQIFPLFRKSCLLIAGIRRCPCEHMDFKGKHEQNSVHDSAPRTKLLHARAITLEVHSPLCTWQSRSSHSGDLSNDTT